MPTASAAAASSATDRARCHDRQACAMIMSRHYASMAGRLQAGQDLALESVALGRAAFSLGVEANRVAKTDRTVFTNERPATRPAVCGADARTQPRIHDGRRSFARRRH